MLMAPGEAQEQSEQERVTANIRRNLRRLADKDGNRLTPEQARRIADIGVDWHDLEKLLKDGCPLLRAVEIVL